MCAGAVAPLSTNANLLFMLVLLGTWVLQGCIFLCGLQLSRFLMATLLRFEAIEGPMSTTTLVYDCTLSMSIGAAGGFFFSTDAGYASNPLTRAFGVEPWTNPFAASVFAGSSMVVGFIFAQSLQNALFPANTTWADSRKMGKQQLKYTSSEVLLPYRTPYG